MSSTAIDLRHSRRVGAAICVVAVPALVGAITALAPNYNSDSAKIVIPAYRAHLADARVEIALALLVTLLVPIFVFGLYRLVARRVPVLAAVGGLLALAGWVLLPFVTAMDVLAYDLAVHGGDPAIWNAFSGSGAVAVAAVIFALGHEIGTLLLGVALWRTRAVSRWAAGAVMLGDVLHLIAHVGGVRALDLAGLALLTLECLAVARAIVRTADDEWDLPPVVAASQDSARNSSLASTAP
jgi:hypothetical protein